MAARFLISKAAICLLVVTVNPVAAEFAQFAMGIQNYSLPPLPYAYDVRPLRVTHPHWQLRSH